MSPPNTRKVARANAGLGRYDSTNSTSESSLETPEQGWDAYFASLFKKVDKRMLDEDKKRYQGESHPLLGSDSR